MKYVAYHRVSDKDQHLDRGIAEIMAFCESRGITLYKNKVYTDKQTGKNFDRPKWDIVKDEVLEPGDSLIVAECDRLGRNKKASSKELRYFQEHDIRVMMLDIPTTLIDLSTIGDESARLIMEMTSNILIEVYTTIAEQELRRKEKRQREGLDAKKARGEWADMGRPRVMPLDEFRKHYAAVERGEKTKAELQRELGMKHASFFNYCRKVNAEQKRI